jgi:hypothetical protein
MINSRDDVVEQSAVPGGRGGAHHVLLRLLRDVHGADDHGHASAVRGEAARPAEVAVLVGLTRLPRRRRDLEARMLTARFFAVLVVVIVALIVAPEAHADMPLGPARYVPCPVPTDDPERYEGENAPFRCRSAVADPDGLVVILREGRAAAAGPGPFGVRHAAVDRGVGEDVIARVVSNARPVPGEQRRLHYIAELGDVAVWVVVDRGPSRQAPDTRPFGVITTFCKSSADADPAACRAWVNAS